MSSLSKNVLKHPLVLTKIEVQEENKHILEGGYVKKQPIGLILHSHSLIAFSFLHNCKAYCNAL